jgi:hypothetical protein
MFKCGLVSVSTNGQSGIDNAHLCVTNGGNNYGNERDAGSNSVANVCYFCDIIIQQKLWKVLMIKYL